MSTPQDYDYLFKVLLIGNSSVGKSSLLLRFVDNQWNDLFVPTIGVDFKIRTMEIDNKNVKLQIWDTAGQERFKNITASYYRGAHGIFVVYDISDTESFKNINNWLIEIEKNANKNVYKILVGNKCDLDDKRTVSYQQGKELAETYGMQFIETSAKSNTNVDEAFHLLGREVMKMSLNDKEKNFGNKDKNKMKLDKKTEDIVFQQKQGCCGNKK